MSSVELATWFVLGLFWLSRLALIAIVVAVIIAIVRVLRLPPYVPEASDREERDLEPPLWAMEGLKRKTAHGR
jgi:hypothetical protein